jgi:hypothetical protein
MLKHVVHIVTTGFYTVKSDPQANANYKLPILYIYGKIKKGDIKH